MRAFLSATRKTQPLMFEHEAAETTARHLQSDALAEARYILRTLHPQHDACAYVSLSDVRRTSKGLAFDEALIEALSTSLPLLAAYETAAGLNAIADAIADMESEARQ